MESVIGRDRHSARSCAKVLFITLVVLSFVAFSVCAFGQAESGSISGTVRDSSGAVVSGAAVKITSTTTGSERTSTTGTVGQYNVPGLNPGIYDVTITTSGFSPFKTRTEVTVGGSATVDAQLTVGNQSVTVEVVGEGATQVNTQTQEMSQLIDTQQLAQLPSLTRNPYDFVAVSGNVSSGDNTTNNSNSGQNITPRGVGYSINGQRESGTEILLDGVENTAVFNVAVGEQVPVDAVQEYSVITNNFSAEYGRASGGVVNLTTKAGTNAFHGSGWEFNRLSAYTANTYANSAHNTAFLDSGGTGPLPDPKGAYTRNQFGFQVGGPIVKNKLFVFESTEWTRVRSQAEETQEVLDPAFISLLPANVQSYFTTYGNGTNGPAPASGQVTTAGNLVSAGAFGTGVGFPMVNGVTPVPLSTPVFDVVNFKAPFDAGGDVPQNTYRLVGRIDYNLSDKTQMFFRFGREEESEFNGAISFSAYPAFNVGEAVNNQSALYSLNHSFSSNLFSNTKVSFTRLITLDSFNTALTNTPNLMLTGFAADPVTGLNIQLPGLENTAPGLGGLPFGGPQNTLQLQEDLSWTKGKHAVRVGGQFTYMQLNVSYGAYAQAVEQLGAGLGQGLQNIVNQGGDTAGGAFASPLIAFATRVDPQGKLPCVAATDGTLIQTPGCTVTPPLSSAVYGRSYRYKDWAIYAQDSFRITPRLTINYGLRYEHYGVQHNNDPTLDSNFYLGSGPGIPQQVANGQVFIADKSPIGQFWAPNWGTAAPRVGFAYDVFGDGKTSLRGGYGMSYERNFGNVTFNASFNPPASAVVNAVCSSGTNGSVGPGCGAVVTNNDLGILGIPGPAQVLPPSEIRMPAPNINTAQTQFWSLALQRQLARNTILELSYSGARGVHLYDIENINLLGAGQAWLSQPLITGVDPATGNTCPYTNPSTGANECYTRPNQQYSNINMRGSLGESSYNSLNLKIQTQNLHNTGLSLVGNYTWAHSLDDLSSTFSDNLQGGSGAIGSLGYTNALDPRLDWGNSDFDVRNRVVISPIWETPWFKSGNGFARETLGGWSIVGIVTARSGTPFSIFDYNNNLNFYTVPRLTPASPITDYHVSNPVETAPNLFSVYTPPVPASLAPLNPTLGISDFGPFPADMTHRNAFRGFGAWNTDMAVGKNFKVTERVNLSFRAEGFDVFNHHDYFVNTSNLYYGLGNTALTVTALKGGLGNIATGGNHDERRFGQFSLRVNF
jgi:hypothetical protein